MNPRFRLVLFFIAFMALTASAQDTLTVQTLTFDSITTRRGTWQFPEGESFRKILMLHTLKCDPQTTHDQYPCGEWDYLTYSIVYQHTGVYDSTLYFHPNFTLIEGTAPDSLLLSSVPTYYYRDHRFFPVSYPDTLSLQKAHIGTMNEPAAGIIRNDHRAGRSQFLWKAEELLDQGFEAGPITSIEMIPAVKTGAVIRHLMIRMGMTDLEELTAETMVADLDTVFYRDSIPVGIYSQDFDFFQPFEWDGVSNIVVDFSFSNPEPGLETAFFANDPGFDCGITAAGNGYALDLDGISDFIKLPEATYFNSDFTFETWFLKRSNNNWSRIFDFGNGPGQENVIVVLSKETSGKLSFHVNKDGLSRSFEMTDPTPLHEWTHISLRLTGNIGWAYINGDLAKYGLLQTPPDMERTVNYIGRSNWASDKMADVLLDEFRVYKTALPPETIKTHYRQELTNPASDTNLVVYYKFDEGTGQILADSSMNGYHAEGYGYPNWYPVQGPELNFGFGQYNYRPFIIFERLESTGTVVLEEVARDSVINAPTQVVLFENPDDPTMPTDTITGWLAGYQPVYESWTQVDSVWAEPETTLYKELLPYYGEPFEIIEQYEIGRYITPYGINLSLGPGFTWVYDVTDYAPLLQGMVDLSAGNQQELIDLKFLFIKGTPPRDVLKIDRIWGGLKSFYYKDLDDDLALSAKTLPLLPDASQFRVKTRLTGHGHNSNTGEYPHCCEWKDNEHYLMVNGDPLAPWHIFQYHDCGLNPVYPQGGTWPGAREGWCPGDRVRDHDFEITSLITGDSVTLDYDITPVPPDNLGMGWGNYVTNMDLIHYGANHFARDVEIYDVISPGVNQYYSRRNPVCEGATLIVRNNGNWPVQSIGFEYGVSGGPAETFTWTGVLHPHTLDTVRLPVPGYAFWLGDDSRIFTVSVTDADGEPDQYAANDTYRTRFNMPDLVDIPIVLALKTNKQAYRYTLEVRDIAGNPVMAWNNLENNTVYQDTLDLPFGCYSIELTDTEDMGLSYWAYPEQGTGYFRIYDLDGNTLKNFNSEFGRTIFYTYHVGEGFYIQDPGVEDWARIYPNPSDGMVNIELPEIPGVARVRVIDPQGRVIAGQQDVRRSAILDLSEHPAGIYLVEIFYNDHHILRKLILQ